MNRQWARKYITKLKKGLEVEFTAYGKSMEPYIMTGSRVKVVPYKEDEKPQDGDVVLCKVGKAHFLHNILDSATTNGVQRVYQIGNNKGHTNGWIERHHIYGKYTETQ